jgi:hypothetical protein
LAETRTKTEISGLTATQERALVALLSTTTTEEAAKRAGLTSRTLRRYLRIPEFRAEYLERRREIVSAALTLAQQRAPVAVSVLSTIMGDTSKPPTVRVSAASKVLDVAVKGVETEDLVERVAELQAEIDKLKSLAQLLPRPVEQPNGHQRRGRYVP